MFIRASLQYIILLSQSSLTVEIDPQQLLDLFGTDIWARLLLIEYQSKETLSQTAKECVN